MTDSRNPHSLSPNVFAQMDEKREALISEQMARHFFENWAPEDLSDRIRFEVEFFNLVRRIYIDASKPVCDQIAAIHGALAPLSNLVPR